MNVDKKILERMKAHGCVRGFTEEDDRYEFKVQRAGNADFFGDISRCGLVYFGCIDTYDDGDLKVWVQKK